MELNYVLQLLPIIIPLFTALLTLILGKSLKKYVSIMAVLGIGATAGILLYFFFNTGLVFDKDFTLDFIIPVISNIQFSIGLHYDALGLFMAIIASGLSFLIALFSVEYMEHDQWPVRYWFFFQIFVASMNLLVLAGDLLLLYIGWEGVGLCSFALIAHWYKKKGEEGIKPAKAGVKAFVFTHIADIGLLLAIAIIFAENNTLSLVAVANNLNLPSGTYPLVLGLIFLAALGKSAQFPFLTWLSSPDSVDIDAMQGPTTVSALIHAATMVKAGIYIMARFYSIFNKFDVVVFAQAMAIIVVITLIISALSALTAQDLKRVLAYSTISQLSYMLLALCVAYFGETEHNIADIAFLASQAHVLSHAIFKALLFLSAAAIIHSIHTRSMFDMGGLREKMPIVFYSMVIGALALIGFPLFSGFFSKDAIIEVTYEFATTSTNYALWGWVLFISALLVVAVTAAYTTRVIMLVFTGSPQTEAAQHPKSPGIIMKVVLVVLAVLSFGIGYLVDYFKDWFSGFIQGGSLHLLPSGNGIITANLSLIMVLIGIITTMFIYRNGNRVFHVEKFPTIVKYLQKIFSEGFYIDQTISYVGNKLLNVLYVFRKIHTGNLNINMFGIGLVFILVFTAVMIF